MARKNTQQAVEAWIKGGQYRARGRNGSPIWTSGGILYSYTTAIGKWSDADPNTAILNFDKYSVTTSCQQGGVNALLAMKGKRVVLCPSEAIFKDTERE